MTARKGLVALALSFVAAFALAGCGSGLTPTPSTGTGSQASAQEVTVTARDNLFDPKSYEVEAGRAIKLTVVNAGQNVHQVEVKDILPETQLAAGQSKTVDIPAQAAGTYKLYCEIHEDSGMVGEFVVK